MLRLAKTWEAERLGAVWKEAGLLKGSYTPPRIINNLTWDSRLMHGSGETLFLALRGVRDGHAFIGEALARGASAAQMKKALPLPGWVKKKK